MTLPDSLTAKWAAFSELAPHDVHDLLKLRQEIFILEQTSLYADIDGRDPEALHYLIRDRRTGVLTGAIRLFTDVEDGQVARIGRVVIARDLRGSGLGRIMMQAGVDKAHELLPGCPIHVTAQAHLEDFYNSLGFRTVSEPYLEDDIPHIDMIHPG